MRQALLSLMVLGAIAVVIAMAFGPRSTPRVERGPHTDASGVPPGARTPRVRTVQPKVAPDELEDAPLDVAEAGPCDLFLVLTDSASGAPVRSVVDLYRLDIPENDYWTRGDRLQAQVVVPPEGWWLRDLPAARYRVVVHEQRLGSDDPAAFGVEGAETRVSLRLPMPREFDAYLKVRDADGEIVHGGGARGGSPRWGVRKVTPDWLTARILRRPDLYHPVILGGGSSGGGRRMAYSAQEHTADGYRLRPWRQSSKRMQHYQWWGWSKEGWTGVTLRIDQDLAGDRHYAGVSREREPILDSILMPDGTRAVDEGATVAMASYPIEVTADTPADAWRACKINVQVKLEGYKPLSFDLALDEEPSVRTLEVAPAKN